ncbi:MAG: hypothetical protein ACT4TC_17995 [Myxococcaceae bacterium]
MSPVRTLWIAALGLTMGAACSSGYSGKSDSSLCAYDEDFCSEREADHLVAEVLVSAQYGHFEQDFDNRSLNDDGLLELYAAPPINVEMTISRPTTLGGAPQPYLERVTLRAQGSSDVLPGVGRSYNTSIVPAAGFVRLPVGAGTYELTLTPALVSIPPVSFSEEQMLPGVSRTLNVTLPHADVLYAIEGQVVKTIAGAVNLTSDQSVDVQVLHPTTLKPLSQRIAATSNGQFRVLAAPTTGQLSEMIIDVTPTDPKALLPSKRFRLTPVSNNVGKLELGDFGVPVEVSGTAVDSANNHLVSPSGVVEDTSTVEGATVLLEGTVAGGGRFRSRTVITDAKGRFTITALPTVAATLALSIIPPADNFARVLQKMVAVKPAMPGAPVELGAVQCQDRVGFTGVVLTPAGAPVVGARVKAAAFAPLQDTEMSNLLTGLEATTDAQGEFSLLLDPALYHFEISPPATLELSLYPPASRFVSVEAEVGLIGAGTATPPTREFILSPGRRVKGQIWKRDLAGAAEPAPFATVRLFRVGTTGGVPISEQLAQGISDANGNYTLLVPTR